MAVLQIREALRAALDEEMERDVRVFLMGEEVGHYDGAYKVSQGLLEKYGEMRVVDTPICEAGFAGVGIGAAMAGLRPVVEFMTFNFSLVAFDQLINNAAKLHHLSNGQFTLPIVFRGPNGAAHMLSSTHSQAFDAMLSHVPGLKVVSIATPYDAKGLLKSAIRDPNPVIFFESEVMYSVKGEVPDEPYLIPLGQADVKRPGGDVTVVTWGQGLPIALRAAELCQADGIDCEVVDVRTLRPMDLDTIYASVRKTHRAVVVAHEWPTCGVSAQLAARIQADLLDELDAPVLRETYEDVNMPYAENLERLVIPSAERVRDAILRVAYHRI